MDESIFENADKDESQEPSPAGGEDVEQQRAEQREQQPPAQQEPDARDGAATNPGGPGF